MELIFKPPFCSAILCLLLSTMTLAGSWADPVQIRHMVVSGNAFSDTGNTCTLFDELSGRRQPSQLWQDIRYHAPDIIDAASSVLFSVLSTGALHSLGFTNYLEQNIPYITRCVTFTQQSNPQTAWVLFLPED